MRHDRTSDSDTDLEVAGLIGAAGSRPVPGADRAERVRAAVEHEWRAQARARKVRLLLKLAGAGVAMLAVAASMFFAMQQRPTSSAPPQATTLIATLAAAHGAVTMGSAGGRQVAAAAGQQISAGSTIHTNGTSRATLTLIDGSEVRIDTDTAATLVDARTIQLERGAIYIDSGASTPGSFTVRTALGTIRDIGTRFEVRLLRQGFGGQGLPRQGASIKVRTGAVQLERAGRIDRAPTGTELVVSADGALLPRPIDPFAAGWAWTTQAAPPFKVEKSTLEAFLLWAAREGGWTIDWSDAFRSRARTIILSSPIDGTVPAEALDVVLPTCGLSWRIVRGRLRVTEDLGSRFGVKEK